MEFGIKVKGMDDIMRSIDKLSKGIDPQELAGWAKPAKQWQENFVRTS